MVDLALFLSTSKKEQEEVLVKIDKRLKDVGANIARLHEQLSGEHSSRLN